MNALTDYDTMLQEASKLRASLGKPALERAARLRRAADVLYICFMGREVEPAVWPIERVEFRCEGDVLVVVSKHVGLVVPNFLRISVVNGYPVEYEYERT